jgi:hypothetical protein
LLSAGQIGDLLVEDATMTVQVDDHSLPPAVAAAAVRAADAVPYVHPATPVHVECSAVPLFDVIVEPVTGRLDLVGEFDLALRSAVP